MGYASSQKGYKVYNPNTGKLAVSKDVRFDEYSPYIHKRLGTNANMEDLMNLFPLPIPTEIHEVTHAHINTDNSQLTESNAFLHGDLGEEVYMKLPPGHPRENEPNKVCILHKAIYGLKQSPRAWYSKLSSVLEAAGFKMSHADSFLFVRSSIVGKLVVLIYVDDLIITDEANMMECKPARTPLASKLQWHEKGEPLSDPSVYQRMVGKLIYLTITRHDISYSVSLASQFMHSPTLVHWEIVKRILRYLKGSVGRGIIMKNNGSNHILAYTDIDWARNALDRKSTTCFSTFVEGNLVTWKSKKQTVIARSSAEA
ncbi:unnamed protein product [Malus baccata var. baccata]